MAFFGTLFKRPKVDLTPDENVLEGLNYIDKTIGRSYKRVKGADGKYTVVEEYAARGTPEEQAMVERGRDIQKNALENIYSLTNKVPGAAGEFSPYIQAYVNLGKQNITDSYAASLQAQGNTLGSRGMGGGGSYSQGAKAALDTEYGKALQSNYWDSILKGTVLEGQALTNQQNAYNFAEGVINPVNTANISATQAGIAQNNANLGLNSAIQKNSLQKNSIGEDLARVGVAAAAGALTGGAPGAAKTVAEPEIWNNPNTGQPAGTSGGAFNQQPAEQPWYHIW